MYKEQYFQLANSTLQDENYYQIPWEPSKTIQQKAKKLVTEHKSLGEFQRRDS